MITLAEVKEWVEDIRRASSDDEVAHSKEDSLHVEILKHHAEQGCPLAAEALKAQDIDFSRWCA